MLLSEPRTRSIPGQGNFVRQLINSIARLYCGERLPFCAKETACWIADSDSDFGLISLTTTGLHCLTPPGLYVNNYYRAEMRLLHSRLLAFALRCLPGAALPNHIGRALGLVKSGGLLEGARGLIRLPLFHEARADYVV
jgi:hypothetical protein